MNEITSSWGQVRVAYDRAAQMAVQTVEAYAEIGDMLLVLKDATPHGEFAERCAEALAVKSDSVNHILEADAVAARQRASRYMRLAQNRAAWLPHNPQSLNEAMKLVPKRAIEATDPAQEKVETVKKAKRTPVGAQLTKLAAAADLDIFRHDNGQAIKKRLHETFGVKTVGDLDMDDPKTYEGVRACVAEVAGRTPEQVEERYRSDVSALSQKDKRRVEKLEEQLRATYIAEVQRGVQEEYKRQQADLIAEMVAERDGYMKKYLGLATMKASMTAILTEDDYRFLLNVLHPDRAPSDRRDKFAKAFDIVRKLDPYIQAVKA
jgi:hypothetical protein